ncbi:MAG TPA: cysteine--tRNA ligase [Actinomycetota bacterium]|nr:cysteine--tRNA ligase [Actinomycetota bacterium]
MTIRIEDTLARAQVDLTTREPGRVAMYVCGPTVYNFIHIGNARTFLWFDLIHRYLEYRGYDVTLVMNYTDVDDRIIERANIEKIPTEGITKKYEAAFEADMTALGMQAPDILTRATGHIIEMIAAIEKLVANGSAYEAGGNVWFAVESFDGYGKLSGRTLDDMRAGERVEPHESKRNPLDFSLWKASKEGEPSWESPWGPGRPGWHIECSVMSTKYLGMGFDIHGGAVDLIFPHHENEIAQAEALAGEQPFVRHWLHAAHVLMEAEKMSKSLGNVVLARDAVEKFRPEAVRYWALMGSYRSQVTFSESTLQDASQSYERWKTFFDAARHALGNEMPVAGEVPRRPVDDSGDPPTGYVARFIEAMDDDFNSAVAFAAIHDLVREGNKLLEAVQTGDDAAREGLLELLGSFLELTTVLGFTFSEGAMDSELLGSLVEYLLELRDRARDEKAFERADQIRDRLTELGIIVEDTPAGPRWRLGRATT